MYVFYLLQKRVVIKTSLQRDKDWPKIINIAASKEGKHIVEYQTVECRCIHTQRVIGACLININVLRIFFLFVPFLCLAAGVSSVLREGDNLVVCGTCYPDDLLSSLRKHNLGDVQSVSFGTANSNMVRKLKSPTRDTSGFVCEPAYKL